MISDQNIISWFQGRMEFGPRALGNRSIIMDPRNRDAKEILNLKVKFRESYRPFAPSILIDETLNWFEKDNSANYMTFVYKIIDTKKKLYQQYVMLMEQADFKPLIKIKTQNFTN